MRCRKKTASFSLRRVDCTTSCKNIASIVCTSPSQACLRRARKKIRPYVCLGNHCLCPCHTVRCRRCIFQKVVSYPPGGNLLFFSKRVIVSPTTLLRSNILLLEHLLPPTNLRMRPLLSTQNCIISHIIFISLDTNLS